LIPIYLMGKEREIIDWEDRVDHSKFQLNKEKAYTSLCIKFFRDTIQQQWKWLNKVASQKQYQYNICFLLGNTLVVVFLLLSLGFSVSLSQTYPYIYIYIWNKKYISSKVIVVWIVEYILVLDVHIQQLYISEIL
jgi:hypothetical protein